MVLPMMGVSPTKRIQAMPYPIARRPMCVPASSSLAVSFLRLRSLISETLTGTQASNLASTEPCASSLASSARAGAGRRKDCLRRSSHRVHCLQHGPEVACGRRRRSHAEMEPACLGQVEEDGEPLAPLRVSNGRSGWGLRGRRISAPCRSLPFWIFGGNGCSGPGVVDKRQARYRFSQGTS